LQGLQGPPGSGTGGGGYPLISGALVPYGTATITDPVPVALGGAESASAATLWIENLATQCNICTQPYAQTLPNNAGEAELLDIPVQSVTIANDGEVGKGILLLANVTVKSTNNITGSSLDNRFSIWVQRSTSSTFSSGVTNVYRVEDGLSSGYTNTFPGLGSGTACTSIIYPDLNLAPGTYYYRLVYQSMRSITNTQNVFAQDRSMVLMQIKQ
jgi:hypothetical protein